MPNFTYTRNIPFSTHNPSVDQPDMQTNTNSTDDLMQVNHFSFNDNNGGYHKRADLVNQSSPYVTPAGVGSVLLSDFNEWIFTNASLAGAGIQMTVSTQPPADIQNNGQSFLPGGLLIKWGIINGSHAGFFNGGDTGTVNFSPAFPNNCFNVFTTPAFATATPPTSTSGFTASINNSLSKTSFTWLVNTNSGSYTNFFWVAIGN